MIRNFKNFVVKEETKDYDMIPKDELRHILGLFMLWEILDDATGAYPRLLHYIGVNSPFIKKINTIFNEIDKTLDNELKELGTKYNLNHNDLFKFLDIESEKEVREYYKKVLSQRNT